jgi:hypothetical protein
MQTTIKARCIATGIQSPLEAVRLIWAGGAQGGSQAVWAALTDGLELLSAEKVQQRFATEGIEMTLDAATELQVDAVNQRPGGVVPIVSLDDEHAAALIDVSDGASLHGAPQVVVGNAIVKE